MTDEELEFHIEKIERTLLLRWWIFSFMAIALVIGALGAISNLRSVDQIKKLVIEADQRSIKNEAAIDAAFKQQIIYQQQVAQSIDYMAKKNPSVIVPRAIVRPPPIPTVTPAHDNNKPLTEAELTRPTPDGHVATPTATPVSKKSSTSRHSRRRPQPTPGPWKRFFQPRSTR